jgi:hypothetical protein
MGGGGDFSEANAKPWVDRIAIHTQTRLSGLMGMSQPRLTRNTTARAALLNS